MEKLELRATQREAVDQMANSFTRGAILSAGLGFGKTLCGLTLADRLEAKRVLIFAPLHTRYGWERTAVRQEMTLPVRFIGNANKAERENTAALRAGESGIFIAGREWGRLQDWTKVHVDLFIQDEAHTLANRKSRGVLALRRLKRDYTLLMSGTPWGSQTEGMYSVSRTAWPEWVDASFARWKEEWCELEFDAFAFDKKKIVGEKVQGEYARSLPLFLNPPMPAMTEVIREDIFVDLLPAQKKLYSEMERQAIAWLGDNPLVADLPITKRVRLRQLLLGVASIRPTTKRVRDDLTGEMQDVDAEEVYFEENAQSAKLDALIDFISDRPDESMIISTDSTRFASIVAKRIGAFEHTGNESPAAREQARRDFESGKLKYLVAHPATLGEGWDGAQHVCHILVVLSESDSPVLNQQLLGRINRPGQTHSVVVVNIRVRGTVDDEQAESLLNKELKMRAASLQYDSSGV